MPGNDALQPWTILASDYIHRQPWLTVRKDRVQLPTGVIIEDYFVLEYPSWVNVLAITPDDHFVMIRQYRHGSRTINHELPAGVVDPTDPSPLAAAQRELLEETGYGGGVWSPLMTISANASTHANFTHCFLARGVVSQRPARPESTEDLRVHLLTRSEATDLVLGGGVLQALNAAPLLKFLLMATS